MDQKTIVSAQEGQQEILIKRVFDLPVHLLYMAYTQAEYIEQWMGNKVLNLDNKNNGSYIFETSDAQGNVLFRANGCIHKIKENETIVRTFEMENAGFPVQLEFLDFVATSQNSSQLDIKIVFKTIEDRNNMLKLPFAQGINMAHTRLEKIMQNLK